MAVIVVLNVGVAVLAGYGAWSLAWAREAKRLRASKGWCQGDVGRGVMTPATVSIEDGETWQEHDLKAGITRRGVFGVDGSRVETTAVDDRFVDHQSISAVIYDVDDAFWDDDVSGAGDGEVSR